MGNCDDCVYLAWDDETGESYCTADLDEDEMARLLSNSRGGACPAWRRDDGEYSIVRKQN